MELIARSELRIEASPDAVWTRLTDFAGWRGWMPGVRWAVLEGAPGTRRGYLTIKPDRGRQTAYRVALTAEPRRLVLAMTFGPLAQVRRTWEIVPDGTATRAAYLVEIDGPLRRWLVHGAARRAGDAAPALLAALARSG